MKQIHKLPKFDKLVVSGSKIEHFWGYLSQVRLSPESIALGVAKRKAKASLGLPPDDVSLASSVARARAKLTRLVYANSYRYYDSHGVVIPPKFLTLTFKENISGLSDANRFLKRFIRSVNGHFKVELAYVCVPEFQLRGAVHFHLIIFNLPFADKIFSRLRRFWPDRFELKTISRVSPVSLVNNYVLKYVSKQTYDSRFFNKKRYSCSRFLFQPLVSRDPVFNHFAMSSVGDFRCASYPLYLYSGILYANIYMLPDGVGLKYKFLPPAPFQSNRGSQ